MRRAHPDAHRRQPWRDARSGGHLRPNARPLTDTLHFPFGAAAAGWDLWPGPAAAGLAEAALDYGLLIENARWAWRPPRWSAPELARRGDAALWLRWAGDRTVRERLRRAGNALAQAERDVAWWRDERAPALAGRHAELASTHPHLLDEPRLATLLSALATQYAVTVRLTQRLFVASTLAVGAYLHAGRQWLGAGAQELAAALPPLPVPPEQDAARRLFDAPGAVIEPEVGLRLTGGCDVGSPLLAEQPALWDALAKRCAAPKPADEAWHARGRALADRVPARHFRAFLERWELAARIHGAHLDALAHGPAVAGALLHRALLTAGERLAGRGLDTPQAVFSTSPEPVIAALLGGAPPAPVIPPTQDLGQADDVPDPRAYARLPAAAQEVLTAWTAGLEAWFGTPARPLPGGTVEAVGIGSGRARGPLLAAHGTLALWQTPPGAVALIDALSPTLPVLPAGLAAVVVRSGGIFSPAARGVRAAGAPAVLGVGAALDAWPQGTAVEVDAPHGSVRSLGGAP